MNAQLNKDNDFVTPLFNGTSLMLSNINIDVAIPFLALLKMMSKGKRPTETEMLSMENEAKIDYNQSISTLSESERESAIFSAYCGGLPINKLYIKLLPSMVTKKSIYSAFENYISWQEADITVCPNKNVIEEYYNVTNIKTIEDMSITKELILSFFKGNGILILKNSHTILYNVFMMLKYISDKMQMNAIEDISKYVHDIEKLHSKSKYISIRTTSYSVMTSSVDSNDIIKNLSMIFDNVFVFQKFNNQMLEYTINYYNENTDITKQIEG